MATMVTNLMKIQKFANYEKMADYEEIRSRIVQVDC